MQAALEQIVANDRFSMKALFQEIEPSLKSDPGMAAALNKIASLVTPIEYSKLLQSIVRQVFLIELVKVPKIETTKMRVRWFEQLNDDPRFCSYEECLQIARDLIAELADSWLEKPEHREMLNLFAEHSILSYEIPIDYQDANAARIHARGNLIWIDDSVISRTLKLRAYLTDARTNQQASTFSKALDDKIKIKTYLTDRALTGVNKTNREKRWETHPQSVQFSTRLTCLGVEYALFVQLCSFDGFPSEVRESLQSQGVLPQQFSVYRCPIIQEPMGFEKFKDELLNPRHGKSSFQVGHLNPLTLNATDKAQSAGHTADNIGWISADGNRIQGHLSLEDTRALLRRIARNYEELNLV